MATDALPMIVFARAHIDLCDDMIAGLHRLQATHPFQILLDGVAVTAFLAQFL